MKYSITLEATTNLGWKFRNTTIEDNYSYDNAVADAYESFLEVWSADDIRYLDLVKDDA